MQSYKINTSKNDIIYKEKVAEEQQHEILRLKRGKTQRNIVVCLPHYSQEENET